MYERRASCSRDCWVRPGVAGRITCPFFIFPPGIGTLLDNHSVEHRALRRRPLREAGEQTCVYMNVDISIGQRGSADCQQIDTVIPETTIRTSTGRLKGEWYMVPSAWFRAQRSSRTTKYQNRAGSRWSEGRSGVVQVSCISDGVLRPGLLVMFFLQKKIICVLFRR